MSLRSIGGPNNASLVRNMTQVGAQSQTDSAKKQEKAQTLDDSVKISAGIEPEKAQAAVKEEPVMEEQAMEQPMEIITGGNIAGMDTEPKARPKVSMQGREVYTNPNGTLTPMGEARMLKTSGRTAPVFDYISNAWQTLRRSATNKASLVDTKAGTSILYVPEQDMARVGKEHPDLNIRAIRHGVGFEDMENHGLLYLPHDYIVPGGRFNEMYGWDSYFTVMGLVQDGETKIAEGMVKNMFYEVDNYGKILNANRSYYLSRSSPPFQSSAVLAVYEKTGDKKFLKEGIDHVIKEYNYWTNPDNGKEMDHLTPTGLSRYYSPVQKPCPEVEEGYYDHYGLPKDNPQFCQDDRAERESGWDMTDRYGYHCTDFNPVDLNSFLYKYEKDLAVMYREVEGPESANAKKWDDKAAQRKDLINKYCWNEEKGMFVDYNFKEGEKSGYESLATFAPLWAGVADQHQADKVMANLDKFEMNHGLATSSEESGARALGKQWDHPAGWAPLHILSAKGMRNYGYNKEADRVSVKFLDTITGNFDKCGGILEKYNVKEGTADVEVGYGNQVGFGWTNAAFLELHHDMSDEAKAQLEKQPE